MPVDSQAEESFGRPLPEDYYQNCQSKERKHSDHQSEVSHNSEDYNSTENYILPQNTDTDTASSIINDQQNNILDQHLLSVRPKVFPNKNFERVEHPMPLVPNKWRRMLGFQVSGDELKSSIFPQKKKHRKCRFVQAKRSLTQLHCYFSIKVLDMEPSTTVLIGLSRKDFSDSSILGVGPGSIAYNTESGEIKNPHHDVIIGPTISKDDTIGCGIIFPFHYKQYADMSSDDSSDGMTDIILSSLLNVNKKSMDFVQCALGLKQHSSDSSSSEEELCQGARSWRSYKNQQKEPDYYNENYVESRTKVEVYFTHNMKIIGKTDTHVPIGGFFPTIQTLTPELLRLQFSFS